jgi:hypothetical protein
MRAVGRIGGAATLWAALLTIASTARADPIESCVGAYDAPQRLQHGGKLREAEIQAIACAQDACPAELRKDCLRWIEEIHRSTPSLVVHGVGPDGCDLERARVFVDGQFVADHLEGKALPLDPGAHAIRVETDGRPPIEQRVILSEGEKNRVVDARFAPADAVCRAAAGIGAPEARPRIVAPAAHARPTPPLVYVLGGAGLLSLGVASGFYVSALSQKGTLDECRPRCATPDVDTMRRTYLVGDVLLTVGVASLAAAAILYFTRAEAEVR